MFGGNSSRIYVSGDQGSASVQRQRQRHSAEATGSAHCNKPQTSPCSETFSLGFQRLFGVYCRDSSACAVPKRPSSRAQSQTQSLISAAALLTRCFCRALPRAEQGHVAPRQRSPALRNTHSARCLWHGNSPPFASVPSSSWRRGTGFRWARGAFYDLQPSHFEDMPGQATDTQQWKIIFQMFRPGY